MSNAQPYLTDKTYDRAFKTLMRHEGGFANDPDDPGGATNYGISLRTLRHQDFDVNGDGQIDIDDIKGLTEPQVRAWYYDHFWTRYDYHKLPPEIAIKAFDLAVNMGPNPAGKCLQRALRAMGTPVKEDGIIGPVTRIAIEAAGLHLLPPFRSELAGEYREIVFANPSMKKYQDGWLRRAYE